MTFTATLDEDSVPSPGAFRVTVNNARRNMASGGVAVSGQTVRLTLASPVAHGDTVKVRYTRPSARPLQGAGGFFAVNTFRDQAVAPTTRRREPSGSETLTGTPGSIAGCTLVYRAALTFHDDSVDARGATYEVRASTLQLSVAAFFHRNG